MVENRKKGKTQTEIEAENTPIAANQAEQLCIYAT